MAKTQLKEEVQQLRKRGLSILEITKITGAKKSSVSYWCRDILLTEKQIARLSKKQKTSGLKAILLYTEQLRRKRQARIKEFVSLGKSEIESFSHKDLFFVGIALYWAEGYKKGNAEFGFTNSDPHIIKLIIKWLKKIYNIHTSDLILRVSVNHIHKNRIQEITNYWSSVTGVAYEQFTTPSLIKTTTKKIYKNQEIHQGTLRIKVRRGANLRLRILGSIEKITELIYT